MKTRRVLSAIVVIASLLNPYDGSGQEPTAEERTKRIQTLLDERYLAISGGPPPMPQGRTASDHFSGTLISRVAIKEGSMSQAMKVEMNLAGQQVSYVMRDDEGLPYAYCDNDLLVLIGSGEDGQLFVRKPGKPLLLLFTEDSPETGTGGKVRAEIGISRVEKFGMELVFESFVGPALKRTKYLHIDPWLEEMDLFLNNESSITLGLRRVTEPDRLGLRFFRVSSRNGYLAVEDILVGKGKIRLIPKVSEKVILETGKPGVGISEADASRTFMELPSRIRLGSLTENERKGARRLQKVLDLSKP